MKNELHNELKEGQNITKIIVYIALSIFFGTIYGAIELIFASGQRFLI